MYQQQHKERKEQVIGIIEKAKKCCETLGYTDKVEIFEDLKRATQEDEFSIVVVGEFSAGKSTFLNALMGKRYLPSYTSETTATVNFLMGNKGANEEHAVIHYKQNKAPLIVPASMENILKYTAVNTEIDVVRSIEKVELNLNSNFLNDGVMLVDSPGLNGVEQGHREITEAQIEKSHACIFLFSAEQPGRKSDFEFLNEIKSKVNRIFLVLNKIDVIRQSEQTIEQVMDKLRENYHKYFPNEALPEIWPIAAYPALVARDGGALDYNGRCEHTDEERAFYLERSRIEAFEERLWRFLTEGEKTKDALLEPVRRVQQLITPLIEKEKGLIEELNKQQDSSEVQQQIDQLQKEIAELEKNLREDDFETEELLDLKIRKMRESIKANIQTEMERYNQRLNRAEELEEYEEIRQSLNKTANSEAKKIIEKVHQEFLENIQEVVRTRYKNYYRDVQNNMGNLNFKGNVQIDQINEVEMSFSLDDYDQKIERLQSEIGSIDQDMESVKQSRIKALKFEKQKKELQNSIQSLQERKEKMMSTLGPCPIKKSYTITQTKEVERNGFIEWILGKKYREFQVVHTNDDEIARYTQEKRAMEQQFLKDEQVLREELRTYHEQEDYSEAFYKEKEDRMIRRQEEKRMEIERLRNKHEQEFKQNRDKVVRKLKNQIEATLHQMETDIINILYTEMNNKKLDVLDIIKDIVEKNVREQCEHKEAELERLKTMLEGSMQERNNQILTSEQNMNQLEQVSHEAEDIIIELDSIVIDEIEFS